MLCYKDITWCNAKDCAKRDCFRNTRGTNFDPDDYWKDKVAVACFKDWCKNYKKESEHTEG